MQDNIFIVTGAASGIGDATARQLADRGHKVISLDIREPTANVTDHYQCDLSDPISIDKVIAKLHGSYRSLVNVAGVPGSVGDELTLRVNILGLRYLTTSIWDNITDGGSVVSISSIAGNNWRKRREFISSMLDDNDFEAALNWWRKNHEKCSTDAYTLSKEAVVMYTMQQAGIGMARGIRVNDVAPGPVETPILPDFTEAVGSNTMAQMTTATNRTAQPEDIAQALVMLAESQVGWINGQHIIVDGGLSAGFSAGWA